MTNIEESSTKTIPNETHYIVKVSLEEKSISFSETIEKKTYTSQFTNLRDVVVEILKTDGVLAIYHNQTTVLLFFPAAEQLSHQYSGNHHKIVSKYSNLFATRLVSQNSKLIPQQPIPQLTVSIIEFASKIQSITYLGWTIFKHIKNHMKILSGNTINDSLLNFRTDKELCDILLENGVDWKKLSPEEKYGSICKVCRPNKVSKGSTETKIEVLSEMIDARENKKYINFIFS